MMIDYEKCAIVPILDGRQSFEICVYGYNAFELTRDSVVIQNIQRRYPKAMIVYDRIRDAKRLGSRYKSRRYQVADSQVKHQNAVYLKSQRIGVTLRNEQERERLRKTHSDILIIDV